MPFERVPLAVLITIEQDRSTRNTVALWLDSDEGVAFRPKAATEGRFQTAVRKLRMN
jgi:hypothetical protein